MNHRPSLTLSTLLVSVAACATAPPAASPPSAPDVAAASAGLPPPSARAQDAPAVDETRAEKTRTQNPYLGAQFYVDPGFVAFVRGLGRASHADAELSRRLRAAESMSTGVWLDEVGHLDRVRSTLEDAAGQEARGHRPVIATFVVYDLPNRDCGAHSSAGEFDVAHDGEARYRHEFIDPIAAQFAAHPGQRIAVILEPDSLANLATNLALPKCAAANDVYRHATAYAVSKLSLPNVSIYLDAAHAGWLGWRGNREKIVAVYQDVLREAGGADKIRGFYTNVSNYNVLRGGDGHSLAPSNPCPDELTYVEKLSETLAAHGIVGAGFVIDTGRNGRAGIRSQWGEWCNVRGAGLGEPPRAAPAPLVDAYEWVKTPGGSDGSSSASDPHFDEMCANGDAAPGAPPAGVWFPSYFLDLVKNADPPL